MPVHTASGGSAAELAVSISTGGFKHGYAGSSTGVEIHAYGDGFKTGWMQWLTEVFAVPSGDGGKSAAGGSESIIHAGLSLRQPLGHTGLGIFPSGAKRNKAKWWYQ